MDLKKDLVTCLDLLGYNIKKVYMLRTVVIQKFPQESGKKFRKSQTCFIECAKSDPDGYI